MKYFILLLVVGACVAAAIEDDAKALEALMQAIDSNELDAEMETMADLPLKNGVSTGWWHHHPHHTHHHHHHHTHHHYHHKRDEN
ncbi:uncharacterized histidine-rich protein DDB_G0274557-like [Patiria miniata]|uniref:Uncharacterized protein n=1 Tax=Patiria miniata TaxID=46514 RepID=A0A914AIP8_PATMI|nr:uncharacterized histidine-rich protein DDB_G0274557-like [Patiria miniata]